MAVGKLRGGSACGRSVISLLAMGQWPRCIRRRCTQACVIARILCGPGQAVVPSAFALRLRRTRPRFPGPFLLPSKKSRGWSTEWRTSLPSCRVPLRGTRAPLGAPSAALDGARSALSASLPKDTPSASSSQDTLVCPGGVRPRSGVRGAYPQTRKRRALLHFMTPHDSALD